MSELFEPWQFSALTWLAGSTIALAVLWVLALFICVEEQKPPRVVLWISPSVLVFLGWIVFLLSVLFGAFPPLCEQSPCPEVPQ